MNENSGAQHPGFARFLLPSMIGAVAFLFPILDDGVVKIPMAIASDWLTALLKPQMHMVILTIIAVSAAMSLWVAFRTSALAGSRYRSVFAVSRFWLLIRLAGLAMAIMIVFEVGPEVVWSGVTGKIVLYDLATAVVTIFVFASFLMPFLTDYGLMELIGTMLSRIFRRLFTLPGRSCIDALASWMSSAPVGVLITSQQYDSGNYSGREAAVIATNFSVVSVPFCLIIANTAEIPHLFLPFYATVVFAGFIAALITPRLPPLSRIADAYSSAGRQLSEELYPEEGLWAAGMKKALSKAAAGPGPRELIAKALHNLADICFGLLPPIVALGTLGLILAEKTPLFTWLSYPLVFVLEGLGIPEAQAAAPTLLVGFADMFLPAVLAKSIESDMTRFVVASVSITQLIYMTEVGVLLLKTNIPLSFVNLVQVFLLRTAITLPIVAAIAHLFIA